MEIIYVIIGIACAVFLLLVGAIIGMGTQISQFYGACIPLIEKTNKLMEPMGRMYEKMMKEYENE